MTSLLPMNVGCTTTRKLSRSLCWTRTTPRIRRRAWPGSFPTAPRGTTGSSMRMSWRSTLRWTFMGHADRKSVPGSQRIQKRNAFKCSTKTINSTSLLRILTVGIISLRNFSLTVLGEFISFDNDVTEIGASSHHLQNGWNYQGRSNL